MSETARTYRFAPLDRTGWLLGLTGVQCIAIAVGIFTSGLLLDAGAAAVVVLAPVVALTAFSFVTWRGRPLHEWAPTLLRYAGLTIGGQRRWTAPIPLLSGTREDGQRQPKLPPFLRGLVLLDAGAVPWAPATRHGGVGVVRDRTHGTVSGSLPVQGREFSLLERAEQDRVLQLWGDALSGFCTERGHVSHVQVSEWAAPAGVSEHERFLARHIGSSRNDEAIESYRELLADAGPMSVRHDVLVTVTVDQRRVSRPARITQTRMTRWWRRYSRSCDFCRCGLRQRGSSWATRSRHREQRKRCASASTPHAGHSSRHGRRHSPS